MNALGAYEYQPDAIMDEKYLEGNKIIQTWDNQKNWQRVVASANLRVGPIKDILQFSVNGGMNHYMSNGNTRIDIRTGGARRMFPLHGRNGRFGIW